MSHIVMTLLDTQCKVSADSVFPSGCLRIPSNSIGMRHMHLTAVTHSHATFQFLTLEKNLSGPNHSTIAYRVPVTQIPVHQVNLHDLRFPMMPFAALLLWQ